MLWNQLKVSAHSAMVVSLPVLLSFVVMVPLSAMIDLLSARPPQLEFKLPAQLAALFAAGTFAITFVSTLRDVRKVGENDDASEPSFAPTTFATGIYGTTLIGSIYGSYGLRRDGEPLWLILIPCAFIALAFYGWPRTIHCEETCVSQRNLWGRLNRIPYTSIDAISIGHDGTTVLVGPEVAIEHTQYHIDADTFRYIVSKRSGKPVLPY